jgi:hypothetical protein
MGEDGVLKTGAEYKPGRILSKETRTSFPDFAAYANATYNFKRIQTSLEMLYAGDNFYSPYSMVNNTEAFWAFGSNMIGTQAFQNMEAAEYSKNLRSLKLTLVPKTTSWHGHLKFGYQLNTQNKEARDILVLPYRLNGATMHSTFNQWYNKWGLGTLTEGYDFLHHQGGEEHYGTLAKRTQNRFGDQSYTADNAPHIGGLRANFDAVCEIFVPFESPEQALFNYFAGSTAIGNYRDLKNIWHSGSESDGEQLTRGMFNDVTGFINDIKVTDKDGKVSYYSLENVSGDSADLVIRDESGKDSTVRVSITSESGFVPVSSKKSFNFNVDWALNIAKYVGYKNDLILSLYYETSGITNTFAPLAFNSEKENVLLVSHFLRSEPTIGITKKFYITSLIGFERWLSGKTWTGEYKYVGSEYHGKDSKGGLVITGSLDEEETAAAPAAESYALTGIRQSNLKTTDLAFGVGFDWDIMKRVSLHGRYKWLRHDDANLPFNNYTGNVVSLELKAFF